VDKINANNLLASDRRQKILDIVNQRRSISIEELSEHFPVSSITIRRDLDKLAQENLLQRVHGGAMALSNIVIAPKSSELFANITQEQMRISREASRRITDGDFIIIESGSTCLALVQHLTELKHLKIVTASPRIVMQLAEISERFGNDFEIISCGGILNVHKNFLLGRSGYHKDDSRKMCKKKGWSHLCLEIRKNLICKSCIGERVR